MASDLATYQLQLQQVEAALLTDQENAELLKLKEDLIQVIDLTKQLIAGQEETAGSSTGTRKRVFVEAEEESGGEDDDDDQTADQVPVKDWKVGDTCQAIWAKDGQYYDAVIDEITSDGQVSVTFANYSNPGVTTLALLRLAVVRPSAATQEASTSGLSKKEILAREKEYQKRRKLKKQERSKKMEQAREDEKGKWQNFSAKAFGKKGFVKKSIFKTPENASGRVGIGTCGVSGKEMTNFSSGPKHRKGV